jgi:hypothetical protein
MFELTILELVTPAGCADASVLVTQFDHRGSVSDRCLLQLGWPHGIRKNEGIVCNAADEKYGP